MLLKRPKIDLLWTYVIKYLNGEEIIGTLFEKEIKKMN